MKYWWGYLCAGIFAAISWALTEFAKAHSVLVDMIYPYITRLIINALADFSSGISGILWQMLVAIFIVAVIVTGVLMVIRKKNPIRWFGWVLAVISFVVLLSNALYGLNAYTSPLADDLRLDIADYNITQLNDTAVFLRDKANALAEQVERKEDGTPKSDSFEKMAKQAADGFEDLTYEQTISVFAGSTAPVKKLTLGAKKGDTGITVALTGESAVNPNVPTVAMPFAMCKEMAHRMTIYTETDARFAAFLACISNSDQNFQYAGYLMAYHYCYEALASVPTSTAQACAEETDKEVNDLLRQDLEAVLDFFGKPEPDLSIRTEEKKEEKEEETTDETTPTGEAEEETTQETTPAVDMSFSSYKDVSDLLASWYIQNYVLPLHQEEEEVFDPFDTTQVDLTGNANAKKK